MATELSETKTMNVGGHSFTRVVVGGINDLWMASTPALASRETAEGRVWWWVQADCAGPDFSTPEEALAGYYATHPAELDL